MDLRSRGWIHLQVYESEEAMMSILALQPTPHRRNAFGINNASSAVRVR